MSVLDPFGISFLYFFYLYLIARDFPYMARPYQGYPDTDFPYLGRPYPARADAGIRRWCTRCR